MALFRSNALPTTPTLPKGMEVASFERYLDAQQAVDHLSDEEFPVQQVTIVGTDLHMVERITGRLTYARVAGAGAMSGAWFGLMISVVLWLFTPAGEAFPLLAGVLIGAAFGMLFGVVSYALTGGKRDFTSSSQVVAGRYAIVCASEHAGRARELLRGAEGAHRGTPSTGQGANPYAGPPANPYAGPGRHPGGGPGGPAARDRTGSAEGSGAPGGGTSGAPGGPGSPGAGAPGTPGAGAPGGPVSGAPGGPSTGGSGAPVSGGAGEGAAPTAPSGDDASRGSEGAGGQGGARPSRFGSRPDESPRYGVRIAPEQRSDDARDGESS